MAKTKLYDIEICVEDGVFKIIPYKLELAYDNGVPFFSTDTSEAGQAKVFQCKLTDKRNRDLIAYVLDLEEWNETRTYWDGFSEWQTTEYLTVGDTPARISKWADSLPEYKLELRSFA